ncbi:MAG TPA: carboxypeptidase-like regulatory domain-containing protein [Planctomycetota bacterium]|nr:carboxypeptidase-like regulatory domain-containing protein [Planctomycetota bacterium]
MMKKLLVAAVALAVMAAALSVVWLGWVRPDVAVASKQVVFDVAAAPLPSAPESSRLERSEVPSPALAAAANGTLRVRVAWADGQPAVGMGVSVEPPQADGGFLAQQWQDTDAAGLAEWRGLPSKTYTVTTRHGGDRHVVVLAGRTSELALGIAQGVDLRGVVVDDNGVPVVGATIVLGPTDSRASSERLLDAARTDGSGAFFLRSVPENYLVAAFQDGFVGSAAWRVGKLSEQTPVVLQLGAAAGSIEGTVQDESGQPVAGAWVAQGEARSSVPLRVVQSDAQGRFVLIGAGPSLRCAICAGAIRRAPWRGAVEVRAGRRSFVAIRLQSECTVRGVVHNDDGGCASDPELRVVDAGLLDEPDARPMWARPWITVTDGGDYLVANLASGRVRLFAEDRLGRRAFADLVLEPGEHRVFDLVVAVPPALRGTVVDADGLPLVGWRVDAIAPPGCKEPRATVTATDGAFVLAGCTPVPHTLRCFTPDGQFPALRRSAVVPGGEPLVLRIVSENLPSCFLRGTLPREEPARWLMLQSGGGVSITRQVAPGAAFEFGPVPAGSYWVSVLEVANRPQLMSGSTVGLVGPFVVAPRQHLDIGMVRVPERGEIEVHVVGVDGLPAARSLVAFDRIGEPMIQYLVTGFDGRAVLQLAPGTYLPVNRSRDLCFEHAPIEVRSGERTSLRLQIVEGLPRRVRYEVASDEPIAAAAIWRKQGVAMQSDRLQLGGFDGRPVERVQYFTPGDWELELVLYDGRVDRFPFAVTVEFDAPAVEVRVAR